MNCFKYGKISFDEVKNWLVELREHSYSPLSNYVVTAVIRVALGGDENYYFAGVNVENIDNRLGNCAEESSVAIMATACGKGAEIKEVWVMGAVRGQKVADDLVTCCGKCRQHLSGYAAEDVKVHSISLSGKVETITMGELLPKAFTFKSFLPDIQKSSKPITKEEIESKLIRKEDLSDKDIFDWLKKLETIDYVIKTSQKAVLKLDNGCYVAGTRMEEAAFIAVSAVQSAVSLGIAEFGKRTVEEIFLLSGGREEKNFKEGEYIPLSMSELQVLREHISNDFVPVKIFNSKGCSVSKTVMEAASQIYNFSNRTSSLDSRDFRD